MLPIGIQRCIDFSLADVSGNPVPGRTLTVWQTAPNHLIFLRNEVTCADILSLKDYGDGRYTVTYLPSAAGHDYLELYDQATDISVIDSEDIIPLDWATGASQGLITINQDYGGTDALQVTVASPQSYNLYLFRSADWSQGLRSSSSAAGLTALDANGRWVNSIQAIPGYYNLVLLAPGVTNVLRYNLEVH
jgi:hypothetical protein